MARSGLSDFPALPPVNWRRPDSKQLSALPPPIIAPDVWLSDANELPGDASWEERWGPCSPQIRKDVSRLRICSRRLMDEVLSTYLRIRREDVKILKDEKGRPYVPGAEIDFNLSHSGNRVLLAVFAGGRVGVDLEWVREGRDFLAIARRYFSKEEAQSLELLRNDPIALTAKFHMLWIAKEAALKAVGIGIANGLAETQLLRLHDGSWEVSTDESSPMRLKYFEAGPGYSAAVVWTCPGEGEPAFYRRPHKP